MTKAEAKKLAYAVASRWLESNIGTADPQDGLNEADQERFDNAMQEIADSLGRRGRDYRYQ
jgi:hypothetical protein